MPSVVIGGGPCGVRAAASIGDDALLLERDSKPGGWGRAALPEDLGWVRGDLDVRLAIATLYGAAPILAPEAVGRQLSVKGRLVALPLSPISVKHVLPKGKHLHAIQDQVLSRARIVAQRFIGGGFEQRTYRDWVVQHFGELTFAALHAPYARARWGEPEALNASIARVHHGVMGEGQAICLGEDAASGWQNVVSQVGSIQTDVDIRGLEVKEGRVARVLTEEGPVEVTDWLYCAASMVEVLAWLGDAVDSTARLDATRLPHRHRVQVLFEAYQGARATAHLPSEVHIVDSKLPLFRVTRPPMSDSGDSLGPGALVAHLSLSSNHPVWQMSDHDICEAVANAFPEAGLPAVDPETAYVQRMRMYDPGWVGPWHPVQSRVTALLNSFGIRLVGRTGTHRWIDPGTESLHNQAMQDPQGVAAWELLRTFCDPPVRPDDVDVRLDPFVTG